MKSKISDHLDKISNLRCIVPEKVLRDRAVESFCFFTSTFTVVKHLNQSAVDSGYLPHPGVGPYIEEEDEIIQHAYYQWVPFALFLQAIAFYAPYALWKHWEGNRMKALCLGFNALDELNMEKKQNKISMVRTAFLHRLHIYRPWAPYMILCEFLNLVNLILQLFFTQWFLGGQFFSLGFRIINQEPGDVSPLDVTFPKVTKCHFYKYGPSGTIQVHDIMCVMALNIINEKIYTFMWFWFFILGILTGLAFLWRVTSFILYKRAPAYSRFIFRTACSAALDKETVRNVIQRCNYRDWIFLYYLALNLHGRIFKDLFDTLAYDSEDDMNEEENEADTMLKKKPL